MEKGFKDFFVRNLRRAKGEAFAAQEFPGPDKKRMDDHGVVLTVEPDHILVNEITGDDFLLLDHFFDVGDLIADPGRGLKVELLDSSSIFFLRLSISTSFFPSRNILTWRTTSRYWAESILSQQGPLQRPIS